MITGLLTVLFCLIAIVGQAITADELIAKNIKARGGIDKIKSIQSIRQTGILRFGSTEVGYIRNAKRPEMLRIEATLQGLTAVNAYDGTVGWSIQPFQGRVDPEKMAEDDLKSLKLQADLDGPLIDFQTKGNQVDYLGTEDVDGTEAHKLKITLKNGDVRYVYLDPDYFLEIRIIDQTMVRGVQQELESDFGNYELVNGVYFPYSIETGQKGQPKGQKLTIQKTEINVDLNESIFHFPQAR